MDDPRASRSWIQSVFGNISGLVRDSLTGTLDSANNTHSDNDNDGTRSVRSYSAEEQPDPDQDPNENSRTDRHSLLHSNGDDPRASIFPSSTAAVDGVKSRIPQRSVRYLSPSLFKGYPRSSSTRRLPPPTNASFGTSNTTHHSADPMNSESSMEYPSSGPTRPNLSTVTPRHLFSSGLHSALNTSSIDADLEELDTGHQSRKRTVVNRRAEPDYSGTRTNGHFLLTNTGRGLLKADNTATKKARYTPPIEPNFGEGSLLSQNSASFTRHSSLMRPHSELRSHSISAAPRLRCSSALQQPVSLHASRIERPASSASSLSSRTRAVFDRLQKICDPHLNMPTWHISNEPERWASDLVSSSSCKSHISMMHSVPRARIISDAIYAAPFKRSHQRWQPSREAIHTSDKVDVAPTQPSSSNQPPSTNQLAHKESPVEQQQSILSTHGDIEQRGVAQSEEQVLVTARPAVTVQSMLKNLDGTATRRRSNVFSAKWPELSVVNREEAGTQTISDRSLLPKSNEMQKSSAIPRTGFMDKEVFAFTKPVRRGPWLPAERTNTPNVKSAKIIELEESSDKSEDEMEAAEDNQSPPKNEEVASDLIFSSRTGISGTSKERPTCETNKNTEANRSEGEKERVDGVSVPLTAPSSASENKEWSCKTCFVSNKSNADKCAACGEIKEGSFGQAKSTGGKQWFCKTCFVTNKADAHKCVACGAVRSSGDVEKAVAEASTKSWFCKECFYKNTSGMNKCISCNTPLPTATITTAQAESVFGNRAFKPTTVSSTSGVKFGLSLANSSTGTSSSSITGTAGSAHTTPTVPVSFGLGTSALTGRNATQEGGVDLSSGNTVALPKFGLASSSSAPDFGSALKQQPDTNHNELETIEEDREEQQPATSTTTSGLFPFGSVTAMAAPSGTDAKTTHPDKRDAAPHGASAGVSLFGGTGTLTQTASTPVFPTFGAPSVAEPSALAPIFGAPTVSPSSNTNNEAPSTSLFKFGGGTVTQSSTPLTFGISKSGTALATGVAPSFSVTSEINHDALDVDSKGAMNTNSVEMASPSEASTGTSRPFTFGAAPSIVQPTGPFSFGAAASMAASSTTSSTGGLFSGLNSGSAASTTMTAPFQFGAAPIPIKTFSAPVVPPVPQSFNFGATATTNGGTGGYSFGSTTTPAVFNFGGQPAVAPSFSFSSTAPSAPPVFGAAPTTNFFTPGSSTSSSTTTTRKMLKARRLRR